MEGLAPLLFTRVVINAFSLARIELGIGSAAELDLEVL